MGGRAESQLWVVRLTVAELVLLNNALNEVLHGAGLEEIALRYLRAGASSLSRTESAE